MAASAIDPRQGHEGNPFALDIDHAEHPTLTRLPRGRHSLPREFIDLNHRNRVLLGALDAVAKRGYLATTVTDITGCAGVSRNSFYRHFADKETCFLTAFDVVVGWIGEEVERALQAVDPWSEQVRAAVETTLAVFAADPRLARFCTFEFRFVGPAATVRQRDLVDRLCEALRAGRAENPTASGLPANLEPALIAGAGSLIARCLEAGEGDRLSELTPEITYFLLAPYLDTPAAQRVAFGSTEIGAAAP